MTYQAVARLFAGLLAVPVLCVSQSMTPKDILRRSVQAHGGDGLTSWKTMTIKGTVDMQDGITYRSAYLVFARAPGRLRVEKDMTVARGGRYFYEYFLYDDAAWSRRNLIPERGNLEEMKRWMAQCHGIAHYADNAETLVQKEDAVVQWKEKKDLQSNEYQVIASRPAFVIAATIGKETTDLYIDRENFQFLQESWARTKRVFWNFKKFGTVTMPTQVLEIVTTTRGEQITPYTYESVKFNVPIEDWLFTEDMPKTAGVRK
jgi:hypothetical protein